MTTKVERAEQMTTTVDPKKNRAHLMELETTTADQAKQQGVPGWPLSHFWPDRKFINNLCGCVKVDR